MIRTSHAGRFATALLSAALVVLTSTSLMMSAAPASAQVGSDDGNSLDDGDYGTLLTVEIHLNATGGDTVDLYGLSDATPLSRGSGGSGGGFDVQYGLARSIGDDLGLSRSAYKVTTPYVDPYSEADVADRSIVLSGDRRLVSPISGDDWRFHLDTTALHRTARLNQFSEVDVIVCPTNVADVTVKPTADEDAEEGSCPHWQSEVGAQPITIEVTESPDTGNYWTLVAIMTFVVVILTVLSALLAAVLRRNVFKKMTAGTLGSIVIATALASLMWLMTTIILAVIDQPITDYSLGNDLSDKMTGLSIVVLGFLPAIPFLVAALLLTRADVPDFTPTGFAQPFTQAPTVPGVPTWLSTTPPTAYPPAPAPPASPGSPAPPAPPSQQQGPQPSSQPQPPQQPPPGWQPPV